MKVLLDTNALLYALLMPGALSGEVAEIIADSGNEIVVSAASAWEVATKVRIGKLPMGEALERDFVHRMATAGYTLIAIDAETALLAGRLMGEHRDPFDRIIAAHALRESVPVLSSDAKLDAFGIRRIW